MLIQAIICQAVHERYRTQRLCNKQLISLKRIFFWRYIGKLADLLWVALMINMRLTINAGGHRRTRLIFRGTSTHRPMEFKRQGVTAMAFAIFFGGIFLGVFLGFVIMALLAAASLSSKPKRHRQSGVILPAPTLSPASLAFRWRIGHRPSELGLTLGLGRVGGSRLDTRASS